MHRSTIRAAITTTLILLLLASLPPLRPIGAQSELAAAPASVFIPLIRTTGDPQSGETSAVVERMLELLNAERSRVGCGPLTLDARLLRAAQLHTEDMAVNNFFSHTGSNGSTLAQRVDAVGYPWSAIAENITAGHATPEAAMAGWMNSAGHCQNILNCAYVHVGIGYVYQPDDEPLPGNAHPYYHYWSQVFGQPR